MIFKKIEHKGKDLLFYLLRFFLRSSDGENLRPESLDLGRIRKILVVRQDDRIGNLILTTPLLSALRRFFPQAQLWYLASKTFHTLFSKSNLVDRILVAKKRQYIFHPLSLIFFVRKIRRQRFDLAIDASDENNFSLNNSFLVLLSGARYRIGYQKPRSSLFLNLEVPTSGVKRHASEMHLDLLRHLVGDLSSDRLSVEVDPDQKAAMEKYLREKGVEVDDFLVGMHIGGRGKKRWQAQSFQQLADWITESSGAKVIFVWGPEERKEIGNFAGRGKDQIMSELFSLPALTALIERCDLFVSPDTGAMHLSAAVGTPTLALFLDSDHVKFCPQGGMHRTLVAHNGAISVEAAKKAFAEMVKSVTQLRT
jgi:ADP-heptose:LPS heptosyltransferase